MTIQYQALPSDQVTAVKAKGRDVYGNPLIRATSDGKGVPCRHCLTQIPEGKAYLILAWCPFPETSAYAETGPLFLCVDDCQRASGATFPSMLINSTYCLRPYGNDMRIRYGHERIVAKTELQSNATEMLVDPETAFVDVRNPHTGCYQMRITRSATDQL